MALKRIAAGLGLGALLAGCGSGAAHPQDGTATTDPSASSVITGTLGEFGGPSPGRHTIAATVTAGGYTEKTGGDGVYRLVVPPGTYAVKLTSGNAQCQTSSATVAAKQTVTLDLNCSVK
jgi:hypothetical protein